MSSVKLGPEPPRLQPEEEFVQTAHAEYYRPTGDAKESVLSGVHRALEQLPILLRSLAADFSEMLGLKAALFKAEVADTVKHYAKDALFLSIAAAVGLITLPLLEITLALLIAWALPLSPVASIALGFLIVTVLNGIVAGFLVWKGLKDLTKRSPVPQRTMNDLERDKQWLANGMK